MSSPKLLIAAVYTEAELFVQEVFSSPTLNSKAEARDKAAAAPGKVHALDDCKER